MANLGVETTTDGILQRLWWLGILQGTLAIFFGITAIFWPTLTLVTLVYLFSAFVLGWALAEIILALMSINARGTWWITLLFGIIGLGVGIYLVRHPSVSFATFILVVGLTLIARGIFDIIMAFIDRLPTTSKTLFIIMGAASVVAGAIILRQPVAGGIAFVWVLGLWALVFGLMLITLSLALLSELRSLGEAVNKS
jgi:uncharacterized membrane protein HdeD (DUF308 family)